MTVNNLASVILQVQKAAQDNHLSAQRIYDMIEANNEHVSLNTIKKLLAPGAENQSFNYYQSIEPTLRAMRPLMPPSEDKDARIVQLEQYIAFLQDQIRIKDAQLNAVLKIVG